MFSIIKESIGTLSPLWVPSIAYAELDSLNQYLLENKISITETLGTKIKFCNKSTESSDSARLRDRRR